MLELKVLSDTSPPDGQFDILFVALGYEARSRHIAEKYAGLAKAHVAIAFKQRLVASFEENLKYLRETNFEFIEFEMGSILPNIKSYIIHKLTPHKDSLRILVDVSSMSRPLIASVVLAMADLAGTAPLSVVFTYCPAKFAKPSSDANQVAVSEPVLPQLAGWSTEPEKAVAVICGLGFEPDLALGAVEFLEPAKVWAFSPKSIDPRFDSAVASANKAFLSSVPAERRVGYDLADPYQTFVALESLVYGLKRDMRPIIVPFGPKLFALLAVLTAVAHSPEVTIWRVSGDQDTEPQDRMASGEVVTLRTVLTRRA